MEIKTLRKQACFKFVLFSCSLLHGYLSVFLSDQKMHQQTLAIQECGLLNHMYKFTFLTLTPLKAVTCKLSTRAYSTFELYFNNICHESVLFDSKQSFLSPHILDGGE